MLQLALKRPLAHEVKAEGNGVAQAHTRLQQNIQPFDRNHAADPYEHFAFGSNAEFTACLALVARHESFGIHAPGHDKYLIGGDAQVDKAGVG